MYLNIFIFACLLHLASGIKLGLFLASSGQSDYDLSCCFDRFKQISAERNIQQKSAFVFLPESVSDSAKVRDLLIPKSRKSYPWSVEIWQPEKCLKNVECRRSFAVGNNYAFVQLKDFRSLLSEEKINFTNLSTICIAQIVRKKFHKNLTKAKDARGVRCSILNTNNLRTDESADKSVKTETSLLRVAGIASSPFVYFGNEDNLKGIDVSLIFAVAKKLKMQMSINVIEASKFGEFNESLAGGFFANR